MSRPPQFFISPDRINGSSVTLSKEDARHIVTVLRMNTGEELLLCDGQGMEYSAMLSRVDVGAVQAEIRGQTRRTLSHPRTTLAQALPKSDKMELIVQKATELGVAAVVPLITERTSVKIRDEEKRIARWEKICREASMQCRRPDIPRISGIRKYGDFLAEVAELHETLLLLPWEGGTEPIRHVMRRHPGVSQIVVLIGPEGGFSRNEADEARAQGFHAVSLGTNILRTETAAIAVLSMIAYEFS